MSLWSLYLKSINIKQNTKYKLFFWNSVSEFFSINISSKVIAAEYYFTYQIFSYFLLKNSKCFFLFHQKEKYRIYVIETLHTDGQQNIVHIVY